VYRKNWSKDRKMNLTNKKELAAKVLKVGKNRIYFVEENLSEIKEAITRQDIHDLHKAGAIQIKEVSGRKKIVKRKNRRRTGKVKKKVNNKKQEYVIITRKLRTYLKYLLKIGTVDKEQYKETRKQIRARKFKSKRNLKEAMDKK
jgi:large subunit ribosomal protein L19e